MFLPGAAAGCTVSLPNPAPTTRRTGSRHVTIYLLVLMLVSGNAQTGTAAEKSTRTPAQRKMSSALLDEVRRVQQNQGGKPATTGNSLVKIDSKQRALVDIRAAVTPDMKRRVTSLGGTIVSESVAADSIIAWVPLLKMERLAEHGAVRAIQPAAQATTNE